MIWLYLGFLAIVIGLLALDLGVFHRRHRVESMKATLGWSALWISLGVAFSGVIYLGYDARWFGLGTGTDTMVEPTVAADGTTVYNDGGAAMLKYLTGFVVEKSLAVDNIFVIAMIFSAFRVPAQYQHRVLFWGILGALVMRGAMIAAGTALLTRFGWVIYVFGGFLLLTGGKMLFTKDEEIDFANNRAVRAVRRIVPITERFHGPRFTVRAGSAASAAPATPGAAAETDGVVAQAAKGTLLATPLLFTLVLIELTDVVFAVDSIPAIFAITTDPFLVFTSNVFAILGLRSLYFALAGMMDRFRYLKPALAVVLLLIGVKMLTHGFWKDLLGDHFHLYVLGLVMAVIAVGVVASLLTRRDAPPENPAR